MGNLRPSPAARYQGHVIDEITVNAMTPSMADIGREKIEKGAISTMPTTSGNARICVIGPDLVDKLFPNVDPLDKEVQIGGLPFRVIGVTEKQGSTFGQSQGQLRHRPAEHLAHHLDGPPRAAGLHQGAGQPAHGGTRGRGARFDARAGCTCRIARATRSASMLPTR